MAAHHSIEAVIKASPQQFHQFFGLEFLLAQPCKEVVRHIVYNRTGLENCASFPLQQRKIVLKLVYALLTTEAPLVRCHHFAIVEDLYAFRQRLDGYLLTTVLDRHGIAVGIIPNRAIQANFGLGSFCNVIAIGRERVELSRSTP